MHRRKLLTVAMGVGGAILSGIVAIPTLIAALSPAWTRRSGEAWRTAGRLEDFPVDQVVLAPVSVERGDWSRSLEVKAVYVWRKSSNEVVVFSRSCTDLSCPVNFDSGSECFFCPCHGGIFAKDGTPMAGPPKVPLYRYRNRVRDGELEIDLYSLPPMT
jgi:menaquinol-cytochrome c reductase iron-sulfur subunit